MLLHIQKNRTTLEFRSLCVLIVVSFLLSTARVSYAQAVPLMPAAASPSPVFTPALIKGITLHKENPFLFDFIVHPGDGALEGEPLREESMQLVKYFMAALTTPEDQMWVNLSPQEKDRIIPEAFGQTEMGRDLLAQDYLLKQITASLMNPQEELGAEFWQRIQTKAQELYGVTDIPLDAFNKVWIVPDGATIYENAASVFVVESRLKVMLEEDYLGVISRQSSVISTKKQLTTDNWKLTTTLMKEIILPELEREVNEGANFAKLRQIYNATILATWYKRNLKQSLLAQEYVDQNKTKGIDSVSRDEVNQLYSRYIDAFKEGTYDLIREEYDPATQEVVARKYFSGGVSFDSAMITPAVTPNIQFLANTQNVLVKLSPASQADQALVSTPVALTVAALASLIVIARIIQKIKIHRSIPYDEVQLAKISILADEVFHDLGGGISITLEHSWSEIEKSGILDAKLSKQLSTQIDSMTYSDYHKFHPRFKRAKSIKEAVEIFNQYRRTLKTRAENIRKLLLSNSHPDINSFLDTLKEFMEIVDSPFKSDFKVKSFSLQNAINIFVQRYTFDRDDIQVRVSFDPRAKFIQANKYQMRRIFDNLIRNAVESMGEGGAITVATELFDEDKVRISISDTGEGIPENIRERIFDRHFTTKEKGTGLGLAIIKRFIEDQGGTISVESELGVGTTFTIILPNATSDAAMVGNVAVDERLASSQQVAVMAHIDILFRHLTSNELTEELITKSLFDLELSEEKSFQDWKLHNFDSFYSFARQQKTSMSKKAIQNTLAFINVALNILLSMHLFPEEEIYREELMDSFSSLIDQYNQTMQSDPEQRNRFMPLSLPVIFNFALSNYIEDSLFTGLSKQLQRLPGHYAYDIVALHLVFMGMHLHSEINDDDIADFDVLYDEFEYAYRILSQPDNLVDEQVKERLRFGIVIVLLHISDYLAEGRRDKNYYAQFKYNLEKIRQLLLEQGIDSVLKWMHEFQRKETQGFIPTSSLRPFFPHFLTDGRISHSLDVILFNAGDPAVQEDLRQLSRKLKNDERDYGFKSSVVYPHKKLANGELDGFAITEAIYAPAIAIFEQIRDAAMGSSVVRADSVNIDERIKQLVGEHMNPSRAEQISALGSLRHPKAIEVLLRFLNIDRLHESEQVWHRWKAAQALLESLPELFPGIFSLDDSYDLREAFQWLDVFKITESEKGVFISWSDSGFDNESFETKKMVMILLKEAQRSFDGALIRFSFDDINSEFNKGNVIVQTVLAGDRKRGERNRKIAEELIQWKEQLKRKIAGNLLRSKLEEKAHKFITETDIATAVNLLEEYGDFEAKFVSGSEFDLSQEVRRSVYTELKNVGYVRVYPSKDVDAGMLTEAQKERLKPEFSSARSFFDQIKDWERANPHKKVLALVRHGESASNLFRFRQSYETFSPLTDYGRRQRSNMAQFFKEMGIAFDRYISSDLERAYDTLSETAVNNGAIIEIYKRFRELLFEPVGGGIETRLVEPYIEGLWDSFLDNPEAFDLVRKFKKWAPEMFDDIAQSSDQRTIIATHGLTMVLSAMELLGIDYKNYREVFELLGGATPNLSFIIFAYDAQRRKWDLLVAPDNTYLKPELQIVTTDSKDIETEKQRFRDLARQRLAEKEQGATSLLSDWFPTQEAFVQPDPERIRELFAPYREEIRQIVRGSNDSDAAMSVTKEMVERGLTYEEALRWRRNKEFSNTKSPNGFWSSPRTAKNLIFVALDTIEGFREAREKGDIKAMADLYRKYVKGYKPIDQKKYRGHRGQVSFFHERGKLRGLMGNKRSFLAKQNSPGALLRFAIPDLIDVRNPDALDPLEVELNYWTDPDNALYHIYLALDTIPGFTKARESGDIKTMADLYRERVKGYEPEDRKKYDRNGQVAFFYEVGGLESIMVMERDFLDKKGSPAAVIRFAIPGLIDDGNPDALKPWEVERNHEQELASVDAAMGANPLTQLSNVIVLTHPLDDESSHQTYQRLMEGFEEKVVLENDDWRAPDFVPSEFIQDSEQGEYFPPEELGNSAVFIGGHCSECLFWSVVESAQQRFQEGQTEFTAYLPTEGVWVYLDGEHRGRRSVEETFDLLEENRQRPLVEDPRVELIEQMDAPDHVKAQLKDMVTFLKEPRESLPELLQRELIMETEQKAQEAFLKETSIVLRMAGMDDIVVRQAEEEQNRIILVLLRPGDYDSIGPVDAAMISEERRSVMARIEELKQRLVNGQLPNYTEINFKQLPQWKKDYLDLMNSAISEEGLSTKAFQYTIEFLHLAIDILDALRTHPEEDKLDETLLGSLDQLLIQYNEIMRGDPNQKEEFIPFSIPWLFSLSLADYFEDEQTFKQLAFQLTRLPGHYKYNVVALHLLIQALHLNSGIQKTDLPDIVILMKELELAFAGVNDSDLSKAVREYLRFAIVIALVSVRNLIFQDMEQGSYLEHFWAVRNRLIDALYKDTRLKQVLEWMQKYQERESERPYPVVNFRIGMGISLINPQLKYPLDQPIFNADEPRFESEFVTLSHMKTDFDGFSFLSLDDRREDGTLDSPYIANSFYGHAFGIYTKLLNGFEHQADAAMLSEDDELSAEEADVYVQEHYKGMGTDSYARWMARHYTFVQIVEENDFYGRGSWEEFLRIARNLPTEEEIRASEIAEIEAQIVKQIIEHYEEIGTSAVDTWRERFPSIVNMVYEDGAFGGRWPEAIEAAGFKPAGTSPGYDRRARSNKGDFAQLSQEAQQVNDAAVEMVREKIEERTGVNNIQGETVTDIFNEVKERFTSERWLDPMIESVRELATDEDIEAFENYDELLFGFMRELALAAYIGAKITAVGALNARGSNRDPLILDSEIEAVIDFNAMVGQAINPMTAEVDVLRFAFPVETLIQLVDQKAKAQGLDSDKSGEGVRGGDAAMGVAKRTREEKVERLLDAARQSIWVSDMKTILDVSERQVFRLLNEVDLNERVNQIVITNRTGVFLNAAYRSASKTEMAEILGFSSRAAVLPNLRSLNIEDEVNRILKRNQHKEVKDRIEDPRVIEYLNASLILEVVSFPDLAKQLSRSTEHVARTARDLGVHGRVRENFRINNERVRKIAKEKELKEFKERVLQAADRSNAKSELADFLGISQTTLFKNLRMLDRDTLDAVNEKIRKNQLTGDAFRDKSTAELIAQLAGPPLSSLQSRIIADGLITRDLRVVKRAIDSYLYPRDRAHVIKILQEAIQRRSIKSRRNGIRKGAALSNRSIDKGMLAIQERLADVLEVSEGEAGQALGRSIDMDKFREAFNQYATGRLSNIQIQIVLNIIQRTVAKHQFPFDGRAIFSDALKTIAQADMVALPKIFLEGEVPAQVNVKTQIIMGAMAKLYETADWQKFVDEMAEIAEMSRSEIVNRLLNDSELFPFLIDSNLLEKYTMEGIEFVGPERFEEILQDIAGGSREGREVILGSLRVYINENKAAQYKRQVALAILEMIRSAHEEGYIDFTFNYKDHKSLQISVETDNYYLEKELSAKVFMALGVVYGFWEVYIMDDVIGLLEKGGQLPIINNFSLSAVEEAAKDAGMSSDGDQKIPDQVNDDLDYIDERYNSIAKNIIITAAVALVLIDVWAITTIGGTAAFSILWGGSTAFVLFSLLTIGLAEMRAEKVKLTIKEGSTKSKTAESNAITDEAMITGSSRAKTTKYFPMLQLVNMQYLGTTIYRGIRLITIHSQALRDTEEARMSLKAELDIRELTPEEREERKDDAEYQARSKRFVDESVRLIKDRFEEILMERLSAMAMEQSFIDPVREAKQISDKAYTDPQAVKTPSALFDWLWSKTDNRLGRMLLRPFMIVPFGAMTALPHELGHAFGLVVQGKFKPFMQVAKEVRQEPSRLLRGSSHELGFVSRWSAFATTLTLSSLGTWFGLNALSIGLDLLSFGALITLVGFSQSVFFMAEVAASLVNPNSDVRSIWSRIKEMSPVKRVALQTVTALSVFVGSALAVTIPTLLAYGHYLIGQSPALQAQQTVLDPVSEQMLIEDPRGGALVSNPWEYLFPFSINARHIILRKISGERWSDMMGEVSALTGALRLLEADLSASEYEYYTTLEENRMLWKDLSGQLYDLEEIIDEHARARDLLYQGNRQVYLQLADYVQVIRNLASQDVPFEFKRFYVHGAYPKRTITSGFNMNLERPYQILSLFHDDFWVDEEHKALSLSLLVEFYSTYGYIRIDFPEYMQERILNAFGGWESILNRLNGDPDIYGRIMELKGKAIDFHHITTNAVNDIFTGWSDEDIIKFIDFSMRIPTPSGYEPDIHPQTFFSALKALGFTITPDMPGQFIFSDERRQFLLEIINHHFPEGRMHVRSRDDYEMIRQIWILIGASKTYRLNITSSQIDLTGLVDFIPRDQVASVLDEAVFMPRLFTDKVFSALYPVYYDSVAVDDIPLNNQDDFWTAMHNLNNLRRFSDHEPRLDKYLMYRENLFSQDVDWSFFFEEFEAQDLPFYLYFLDELELYYPEMVNDLIGRYILPELDIFSGVEGLLDIEAVEDMRTGFNEVSPVLGDRFMIAIARNALQNYEISESNIDLYVQAVAAWLNSDGFVDNRDVRAMYRLIGSFIANEIVKFLGQNHLPNEEEIRNQLREAGFDVIEQQSPLWTNIQKLAVYTAQGNWQYLTYKILNRSEVDTHRGLQIRENSQWQVFNGFNVYDVFSPQEENIAYLIVGRPDRGARVATSFDVGYESGGVSSSSFSNSFSYYQLDGREVVFDFPLAFTTGGGKPTDIGIEQGRVENWLMSLERNHGMMIVYANGEMRIVNKSNLRVSELYLNTDDMEEDDRILNLGDIDDYWLFIQIAREQRLSVNTNMLLIDGEEVILIDDGSDARRLLLEFNNGAFGVLNMNVGASTGQAVEVANSLNLHGGVKRAVYADTGYYDFTTLHTLNHGPVTLGHSDSPFSSNRVFLWQHFDPDISPFPQGLPADTLGDTIGNSNDQAMAAEKEVGGIDLNPETIDIQKQGSVDKFKFDFDPAQIHNTQIDGLVPVIINITPVTNIPFLLGIADSDEEGQPRKAEVKPADQLVLNRGQRPISVAEFEFVNV